MMIELKNINVIFSNRARRVEALKNINLTFENKGLVILNGDSGSGKTTLLNLISTILSPTSGQIIIDNENINEFSNSKKALLRREKIAYIYQEYNLVEDLNVIDNLFLAASVQKKKITEEQIKDILSKLGMGDVLKSYPYELSGGQQQRIAIARAMLLDSKIILADEPTAPLDETNSKIVMDLLKELSKTRLVVVVSHNSNIVNEYADRIINMSFGEVVSDNIINFNNDINESTTKINKVNDFKYYLKLGLKYINFKSFKLYISIIIMTICLTLTLSALSVMSYNPQKAYANSLKEENINYSVLSKLHRDDDYTLSDAIFTEEDLNKTRDYFEHVNPILLNLVSIGYEKQIINSNGITIEKYKKNTYTNAIIHFEKDDLEKYNFDYVGRVPEKKNEIMLTYYYMDKFGLNISEFTEFNIYIENVEYSVVGIISNYNSDNEAHLIFQQQIVVVNQELFDEMLDDGAICDLYIDASNFNTISKFIKETTTGEYEFWCSNKSWDSIRSINNFVTMAETTLLVFGAFFVLFSLLIIINQIHSIISERKNDIQLIKMIGGRNIDMFKIFSIQSIFIALISFIISIPLYFGVENFLNQSLENDFDIIANFMSLSVWTILLTIFAMLLIVSISTIIPILKTKKKK